MARKPNEFQALGIERAYRLMAEVGYRPAAPSDGMGNIIGELDLEAEIERYLNHYDVSDKAPFVGVPTGTEWDIFTILTEAHRMLCGMVPHKVTIALLRQAINLLEAAALRERLEA